MVNKKDINFYNFWSKRKYKQYRAEYWLLIILAKIA